MGEIHQARGRNGKSSSADRWTRFMENMKTSKVSCLLREVSDKVYRV